MRGDWLASQSGGEMMSNNIDNGKNNNNNNHNCINIPRGGLEWLIFVEEEKPKNSEKNFRSKDKN